MLQLCVRKGALAPAIFCLLTSLSAPGHAGPLDYVLTPNVEQGEKEIDLKAGTSKARDGSRLNKESIGFGYGVTSSWFTEVYAIWHKEPGDRHGFDAWEWENKFQLTETGKYAVDVGMVLEIERPKNRKEGWEVVWGALLQKELTSTVQANLNVLFSRQFHAQESTTTELGYQWQVKYRWRPELEFGVQGFGALGPWRQWADAGGQSHVVGPALFGKLRVGANQHVKYNAALLVGQGSGSPRSTLRMQAEYEF